MRSLSMLLNQTHASRKLQTHHAAGCGRVGEHLLTGGAEVRKRASLGRISSQQRQDRLPEHSQLPASHDILLPFPWKPLLPK
jgi:hypothetical protein